MQLLFCASAAAGPTAGPPWMSRRSRNQTRRERNQPRFQDGIPVTAASGRTGSSVSDVARYFRRSSMYPNQPLRAVPVPEVDNLSQVQKKQLRCPSAAFWKCANGRRLRARCIRSVIVARLLTVSSRQPPPCILPTFGGIINSLVEDSADSLTRFGFVLSCGIVSECLWVPQQELHHAFRAFHGPCSDST